jgi:hypothetical protein
MAGHVARWLRGGCGLRGTCTEVCVSCCAMLVCAMLMCWRLGSQNGRRAPEGGTQRRDSCGQGRRLRGTRRPTLRQVIDASHGGGHCDVHDTVVAAQLLVQQRLPRRHLFDQRAQLLQQAGHRGGVAPCQRQRGGRQQAQHALQPVERAGLVAQRAQRGRRRLPPRVRLRMLHLLEAEARRPPRQQLPAGVAARHANASTG